MSTEFSEDSRVVTALAPLRVSLAGGGTDLSSYHLGREGLVISLAVNRFVGVSLFPRSFDGAVRTRFEETHTADTVDGVDNPFARAALARHGWAHGLQLSSFSDVPYGTGLGGSGAFTVALVHALAVHEEGAVDVDRRLLAQRASDIEMVDLGRNVGRHDHYMAAYGGVRALAIDGEGAVTPDTLPVSDAFADFVADRLLLFHIGGERDANLALAAQDRSTRDGDTRVIRALDTILDLARTTLDRVKAGDYDAIGEILDEHWHHKKELSDRVTDDRVDHLYSLARRSGAVGGKVLGAGGGGFMLLCAPHQDGADSVRRAMFGEGLRELPFRLWCEGSRATAVDL